MATRPSQPAADRDVLRAIAAAASPTERLQCPAFAVTPNGLKAAGQRAARWEEAVAAGQRSLVERARQALGWCREGDGRAFGDVEVSDPRALPGWAKAVVSWLAAARGEEPAPGPFGSLSADARAFLSRPPGGPIPTLEGSAIDDLVAGLEARLWRSSAASLDHDAQMVAELARIRPGTTSGTGVAALDGSAEAWRARLTQLPGLARVVGVIYHHWRRSTTELLTRLATDLPILRLQMLDGHDPGPLVGVRMDLGDLHGGGRAVALLTFAGGARLYYKPKDLRVAHAFLDLVDFLNRGGLSPELPRWCFIPRDGYAWEQAIEPAPCDGPEALGRFYVRLGMLARLFQLLGARDMWLDNLVAAGEWPAFIDLETMLQPALLGLRPMVMATDGQRAAAARWSATVAALDMFSMPTPIGPGVPAEELGVLAPPGAFRSPFRYRLHEAPADREAVSPEGYILWHHTRHAPTLRGETVDPATFFGEIVDGYRRLQAALSDRQAELTMPGGPLLAMRSAPVRFIPRDTWTYLQLIERSVVPALLADPLARECLLARLFGSLPPGTPASSGAEVVACEIAALRDLDVPYFSADPATTSVRDPRGEEVAGVSPTDAWGQLLARVTELSSFRLAEEVALLRSTLATSAAERVRPPTVMPARRGRARRVGCDELVDRAVGIGQVIVDTAVVGARGSAGWVGLVDQPLFGARTLQPLGPDPLSGTGGLALLFGELFGATGEPRWRDWAERALEGVRATARQSPTDLGRMVERPDRDRLPMVCGLVGVGGAIYVLRALARSLQEPRFLDEATRAATALPVKELGHRSPLDVATGGTGLLLALLSSGDADGADADAMTEVLAEGLFDRAQEPCSAPVGPPALCSQLPDPRAALGLAAARLANGRGLTDVPVLTARLLADADLQLAGGGPAECPGGILCALSVPRPLLETSRVRHWLDASALRPLPPADAPTRLLLDECELLLLLDRHGDASATERAYRLVELMVTRKRRTGTWFPETVAADQHCLSSLDGLPAVAHTLLRLAGRSDRADGSVRTLELRRPE